jgi:hypothetical protein
LVKEAQNYQKVGQDGRIPLSESKQLVNCLRYMISACHFTVEKLKLPPELTPDEHFLDRFIKARPANEAVADYLADEYGVLDHDDIEFFLDDEEEHYF